MTFMATRVIKSLCKRLQQALHEAGKRHIGHNDLIADGFRDAVLCRAQTLHKNELVHVDTPKSNEELIFSRREHA